MSSTQTKVFRSLAWLSLSLTHILFAAHLLFHGWGWLSVCIILFFLVMSFFPRRHMGKFQMGIFALYSIEWVRTTIFLVQERIDQDRPYSLALGILLGVTLWTLLQMYIVSRPTLQNYYQSKQKS